MSFFSSTCPNSASVYVHRANIRGRCVRARTRSLLSPNGQGMIGIETNHADDDATTAGSCLLASMIIALGFPAAPRPLLCRGILGRAGISITNEFLRSFRASTRESAVVARRGILCHRFYHSRTTVSLMKRVKGFLGDGVTWELDK